jgi:hypothetical protein
MDAGRRLRGALAAPVNKDRSESAESSHKLPMPSGDLRAHRSYVLRNVIYKLHSRGGWKKQESGKAGESSFA